MAQGVKLVWLHTVFTNISWYLTLTPIRRHILLHMIVQGGSYGLNYGHRAHATVQHLPHMTLMQVQQCGCGTKVWGCWTLAAH